MANPPAELPLEVLSNVASLILPPFYPPPITPPPTTSTNSTSSSSTDCSSSPRSPPPPHPPTHIIDTLDPVPPPYQTPSQLISAICKSSSRLLEASRPWLWQDVDVRSGRGWLAIVNALTEEVIQYEYEAEREVDGLPGGSGNVNGTVEVSTLVKRSPNPRGLGIPIMLMSTSEDQNQSSTSTPPQPAEPANPAADAHIRPNTIPGGYAQYNSNVTQSTLPQALSTAATSTLPSSSSRVTYHYSPPQPSSIRQLLTPPGSRPTSPSPAPSLPPPAIKSPTMIQTAKLRGRSRSPRRQINFEEGISSVLDRSRSLSTHRSPSSNPSTSSWPKRIPLDRRRSSLSRVRTMHDIVDDDEDKEDGEGDTVMSEGGSSGFGSGSGSGFLHPASPPVQEEAYCNVNPDLLPPPGPYIRHLNFTNFRTIGSRRTQDEAVRGRFVTAGRLEGVIKNAPNLVTLCMTEYVDSALSAPVVEELLFRGYRRPRVPRRSSVTNALARTRSLSLGPAAAAMASMQPNQLDPPRPTYVPYEEETEEEMWKRRGLFSPLEALDLTGCVSRAFTEAMIEFHDSWLSDPGATDEERGRGRTRRRHDSTDEESDNEPVFLTPRPTNRRRPRLSALRRLSLRACTTLDSMLLHNFLLCFPALTHLDLSGTRVPSTLLMALTEQPPATLRLQSLSLARCPKLDTFVVVEFIVKSPAARDLIELNLYVSPTQGNAFSSHELTRLLQAPCVKSGKLRYLDLSSAQFTPFHLTPEAFPPQPALLSLGLSYIPSLPLQPIADFLLTQAPNVEILTLTGTALETSLRPSASPLQINLEIHARLINPLTTVPFSLSALSLNGGSTGPNLNPGPTRLRVVELSSNVRRAILDGGGGSGEWQVIRSKGARGWYVDTSAGWIPLPVDRVDGQVESVIKAQNGGNTINVHHNSNPHESNDTDSSPTSEPPSPPPPPPSWQYLRHLPRSHPWRKHLTSLSDANGRVSSNVGWHSRKMEVVRGLGMLGREEGMAGAGGFAFEE